MDAFDRTRPTRDRTTLTLGSKPLGTRAPRAFPKRIGQYRVLRHLGQGGMGEVLLAIDPNLSREIALKRIRPDRRGHKTLIRRFQTEAHVTALLQHPSVIPVYEYLKEGEHTFYTMRPVQGMTLAELIRTLVDERDRRREWTAARLVRVFLQVCSAIAYAHSMGVLHRDIKPSNIMVGPFEEVFVVDWGMALLQSDGDTDASDLVRPSLSELAEETASQALVGTPAYMAPELLRRQSGATFASEVFALGVLLYELLAFKRPWDATTPEDLAVAMEQQKPVPPSVVRRGRGISARLDAVVLRALDRDPVARYPTVQQLSGDVTEALEGRAPWTVVHSATNEHSRWALERGKCRHTRGGLSILSRGEPFRYAFLQQLEDNIRLEFDIRLGRGTHEISIMLNSRVAVGRSRSDGYELEVLPGRRRSVRLRRTGRPVAGARNRKIAPKGWHTVTVLREDDHLSLAIDGSELYAYRDPIPLRGTRVVLQGLSAGLDLRNLVVHSRSADARVSCLAVPDALFNRQHHEEAMAEYAAIASSHPGRVEAVLARFRSALCAVELQRTEQDSEIRELLLSEAESSLDQADATESSCLFPLGQAIIASARKNPARAHDVLARAFRRLADDPDGPTIREWVLAQLHSATDDDRRWIAELLPLAILHCMGGLGRHGVRELVHQVRKDWEMPSFIVGRGQFRQGNRTSHAESILLLAFWAGRTSLIEETVLDLIRSGESRFYHASDFVFSLLELGAVSAARRVLAAIESSGLTDAKAVHHAQAAKIATFSADGKFEQAASTLAGMDVNPTDRAFNGARLWMARSSWKQGDRKRAFQFLEPVDDKDYFAREHRAWFCLERGDHQQAGRELEPLIERGDHLHGRNLVNFLYGTYLMAKRQAVAAKHVFSNLRPMRWPRTWTLGSRCALGGLGDGSFDSYVSNCFPWERKVLEDHVRLLAAAGDGAAGDLLQALVVQRQNSQPVC